VYYGNHESASSVQDAARELNERIKDIVATTGCSKVNVIAHSKGGLDVRWAASCLDAAPLIASITTINTPHRGCGFAEYLLEKIPVSQQESLASAYNAAALHAGDAHPDFLAAVHDLTTSRCEELTQRMDSEEALRRNDGNNGNNDGHIPYDDIFCQSVGSKLVRAASGKFPLNFTHPLVKWFDGPNDGLVSETSFSWGENYTFLTPTKHRGISHADMIDLDRENIPGFDVREFYVRLVSGLRERGL
jgi:triacylglycerol lipase